MQVKVEVLGDQLAELLFAFFKIFRVNEYLNHLGVVDRVALPYKFV